MNPKRKRFTAIVCFLFITQLSYSKGIFGTYEVVGKVNDSKGNLLKNQLISVYDGKQTQEIRSDGNGNYSFKVFYGTPCRSALHGASFRKAAKEMNTQKLMFSFKEETVEVRTNWKKGHRSGTIRRTLKFK